MKERKREKKKNEKKRKYLKKETISEIVGVWDSGDNDLKASILKNYWKSCIKK